MNSFFSDISIKSEMKENTLLAAAKKVAHNADIIADVSNLTQKQISDATKRGARLLLISKDKAFNWKINNGEEPVVNDGVVWLVISPPLAEKLPDSENRTYTYTMKSGRFEAKRGNRKTPTDMVYLAKKDGERLKDSRGRRMCAVRSEARLFGPSHSLCEIDDVLIHILCYELKKPVLTNDLELRRNVMSGVSPFPVSKPMRLLIKHTQSTLLESRAGHFVPAQGRRKHVRGRTTKKRTRQRRKT